MALITDNGSLSTITTSNQVDLIDSSGFFTTAIWAWILPYGNRRSGEIGNVSMGRIYKHSSNRYYFGLRRNSAGGETVEEKFPGVRIDHGTDHDHLSKKTVLRTGWNLMVTAIKINAGTQETHMSINGQPYRDIGATAGLGYPYGSMDVALYGNSHASTSMVAAEDIAVWDGQLPYLEIQKIARGLSMSDADSSNLRVHISCVDSAVLEDNTAGYSGLTDTNSNAAYARMPGRKVIEFPVRKWTPGFSFGHKDQTVLYVGQQRVKPSNPHLNRGDPLARGLTALMPFTDATFRDIAQNVEPKTIEANVALGITAKGRAASTPESTLSAIEYPDGLHQVGTGAFSFLWYSISTVTPNAFPMGIGDTGAEIRIHASVDHWRVLLNDGITAETLYGTAGELVVGQPFMGVFTSAGANGETKIYGNGVLTDTGTQGANTLDHGTADTLHLGTDGIGTSDWRGHHLLYMQWNRVLTPVEVAQLYADPYRLITPRRMVVVPGPFPTPDYYRMATVGGHLKLDRGDPINHGLRSLLPFQDGVGTTPRDVTGRHTAAFAGSSLPGWVMTDRGQALDCTELIDSYYVTETFELLEPPFTVAVWIKMSDVTDAGFLWGMARTATSTSFHSLSISSSKVRLWSAEGGNHIISTTANAVNDTWFLATGIWTSTSLREVYINGGDKAVGTTTVAPANLSSTTWNQVDRSSNLGGITGQMMLGRTWDRAITEAEIQRLYAEPWAGLSRSSIVPVGIIDRREYGLVIS